ncbi:MAG: response regulator transcription factor [Rhizobiales bacterium]|nr:response regulator transcription factor [Hyphomicrobiales bacterium]
MAATTLLIVDDHPVFTGGFSHMLRTLRPEWTLHAAGSATQALNALQNLAPDLTIIDVALPDHDGFNLLRIIANTWPRLPSVLISGRDDVTIRTRARASGAAGFITKTASPEIIVDMLDTVLGGGLAFSDSERPNDLPVLTPRQAEVLTLLAAGLGNKEIRHQLGIAERTVRAHLTEIFHLLGVHSRMQAIIRGRELGLIER